MQIEDIMIKIKSLDNCEVESYHAGEGEFLPPYLAAMTESILIRRRAHRRHHDQNESLDNCEDESYHAGEGEFLPPYLAATRNDDSRNASSSLFLEECG